MARKTISYDASPKKGCMGNLLRGIGVLFALGILMAMFEYIAAIAAGIGLWFLARFGWRRMSVAKPDNGFVKWGLGLSPFLRKGIAGAVCALVSVCLMAAMTPNSSPDITTEPTSRSVKKSPTSNQDDTEVEAEKIQETKALAFSEVAIDVLNDDSSGTVKASVTGIVTNNGNVSLSKSDMPSLMRDNQKESLSVDDSALDPEESTHFAYEGTVYWDEECSWSFKDVDGIESTGLDGVAESLTQKFEENKEATAAAKEEEARKAEEEAERKRAEAEQKHLESSCWVTASGTNYHEDSGCYLMHGSKNLTEMTVEEARNLGYDPCDRCAH